MRALEPRACLCFVPEMREDQNSVRARRLRREASLPERDAWAVLRKFRQYGIVVRRQHPIDGLIVDFAVVSKRLVIEIDGPLHRRKQNQVSDAERDRRLWGNGWQVIRIPSSEVEDTDALFARFVDMFGL